MSLDHQDFRCLVVHRDRRELGTTGISNMSGKATLRCCVTCLFSCSQRMCLRGSSGPTVCGDKTPRNQYFLLQGPQWTLSLTKVWVDRVLSLRPSFLGLQTDAKGAEVSTDHLKLFLSRRRWQVSLSPPCLCPFYTHFLQQYFFSMVKPLPLFLPELPSHWYIFLQS